MKRKSKKQLKKKIKFAIIAFILVLGLYLGLGFAITDKTIALCGDSNMNAEVFSEYKEPGAVATIKRPLFFGYKKTLPVEISGEVNTNTLGKFTVVPSILNKLFHRRRNAFVRAVRKRP